MDVSIIKEALYRAGITNSPEKDLIITKGDREYPVAELLAQDFQLLVYPPKLWERDIRYIKDSLFRIGIADSKDSDFTFNREGKDYAVAKLLCEQFALMAKGFAAPQALFGDSPGAKENPEQVIPKEYLKGLSHDPGLINPLQSLKNYLAWKDGAPDEIKYDVGDKVWGVDKNGVFFRRAVTEIIVHDFKCKFEYNRVTLYRVTGDNLLYMNHHLHLTYAEAVKDKETTWKEEREKEAAEAKEQERKRTTDEWAYRRAYSELQEVYNQKYQESQKVKTPLWLEFMLPLFVVLAGVCLGLNIAKVTTHELSLSGAVSGILITTGALIGLGNVYGLIRKWATKKKPFIVPSFTPPRPSGRPYVKTERLASDC